MNREEIASWMMQAFEVDLGGFEDYKTLELCSNGSDAREKILSALERMQFEALGKTSKTALMMKETIRTTGC